MFIKEISSEQSAAPGVVQYVMVIWTTPGDACSRMNYCTALSHFLCLDVNGKERNQLVVNTGASMPHPPRPLPIHISLCFIPRKPLVWCSVMKFSKSGLLQCLHLRLNMGDGADKVVSFYGISFLWSPYGKLVQ